MNYAIITVIVVVDIWIVYIAFRGKREIPPTKVSARWFHQTGGKPRGARTNGGIE